MAFEKNHNVYVVELYPAILEKESAFLEENPGHDPMMPYLYVGMTGLDPQERYANHRNGYKANRFVRRYGRRLRPDLYERYNPMTYEDAKRREVDLAKELRAMGYSVWQR